MLVYFPPLPTQAAGNCPDGYFYRSDITDANGVNICVDTRTTSLNADGTCKNPDEAGYYYTNIGGKPSLKTAACIHKDPADTSVTVCKMSSFNWSPIFSPTCWARTLSVVIGTALITVSAWLLALAGLFFNTLINYTVIQFGTLFNPAVLAGINQGWAAMRDVANIVIIGMFVFIAVNMILGVEEYGKKSLVARVLVVAVLINFSLLFSRMIIDASNFLSTQFYTMSGLGNDANNASKNSGLVPSVSTKDLTFAEKGVAGQFIQFAGLPTAGITYDALSAAAFGDAKTNYTTANGWFALLHGVVVATLFSVAAFVLFYGCIILITRALFVTFVMLTSALAFASWLIPHPDVEIGWEKWWKALLKSAFLGPIMIGLLWATLLIAKQMAVSPTGTAGTLGSLITDPTNPLNLQALISYVLIIGLLFGTFYASNHLAGSITGFNSLKKAWSGTTMAIGGTGFGALSRITGLLGRGTVGAASGGMYKTLRDRGWGMANANFLQKAAVVSSRWLGQRTFDPMASKAVSSVTKQLGGLMLGSDSTGKGGYLGVKKRQAKAAEELARAMRPSEEARNTLAQAARAQEEQLVAGQRTALAQQQAAHENARDTADHDGAAEEDRVRTGPQQAERAHIQTVARPAAESAVTTRRQELAEEQERRQEMQEDYARELRFTEQRILNAQQRADAVEEAAARTRLDELTNERSSANAGFATIINQRTQATAAAERQVQQLDERMIQLNREASNMGAAETVATRTYHERHLENIQRDTNALNTQVAAAGQNVHDQAAPRAIAEQISRFKSLYSQGIIDELGGAIREHERDENIGATIRNLMRQQQQQGDGH